MSRDSRRARAATRGASWRNGRSKTMTCARLARRARRVHRLVAGLVTASSTRAPSADFSSTPSFALCLQVPVVQVTRKSCSGASSSASPRGRVEPAASRLQVIDRREVAGRIARRGERADPDVRRRCGARREQHHPQEQPHPHGPDLTRISAIRRARSRAGSAAAPRRPTPARRSRPACTAARRRTPRRRSRCSTSPRCATRPSSARRAPAMSSGRTRSRASMYGPISQLHTVPWWYAASRVEEVAAVGRLVVGVPAARASAGRPA